LRKSAGSGGFLDFLRNLFTQYTPSSESQAIISDYLVTVAEVVREGPKFRHWLFQLEQMPLVSRKVLLQKMVSAFRVDDTKSEVASAFERLGEPAVFSAVCQRLRDPI